MKEGFKSTGSRLKIVFNKGVKFCKDGLDKLGKIFKKSFSGCRNKEHNPNQDELYENPEKDQYKPGYYNIVAKPTDQKIGDNEGSEKISVTYNPGVDPNKKNNKKIKKIQFQAHNQARDRHRQKMKRKTRILDQDILKVSFIFFLIFLFEIETEVQPMD